MSKLPKSSGSVTLEDLLRLKRAERPDADFWNEFERGLRQKQLAAIMEPKPWWLGWSLALKRHGAWVGATATVAAAGLALGVGLRMSAPVQSGGVELASVAAADLTEGGRTADSPASVASASRQTADSRSVTGAESFVVAVDVGARSDDLDTIAAGGLELADAAQGAVGVTPGTESDGERAVADAGAVAAASADVLRGALAQVAILMGEELSMVSTAEVAGPVLASVYTGTEAVDFRSGSAGVVSAERSFAASSEAGLPVATNPRHQRLLAGVMERADDRGWSGQSLAAVRDHVLHHVMDNDELYASISRLGVRGDRLQVSF